MADLIDRVIDKDRITRLLSARAPGVEVAAVEVLDDTSGSANRLRLAVGYAPGCDAGLPPTMFLKRNLERFSFPVEMYTTEVRVYRDVLPGSGVTAPSIYAIEAADDDVAFTILMEDLGARPDVRIGFVLDQTTPDEIDTLLTTLARLHASFWGERGLDRRAPWARVPAADASMRFWREIGPRLAQRHLESGHRAGAVDPSPGSMERLWSAFDRLLEVDGLGPLTFLHGDVHAGNVFYVDRGDGGLLDWQLSLRGSWALDVGYLLTSSLTTEDRRSCERALLDGYLDRLRTAGVDAPSPEEAWLRYRQNALYGVLMWLITPDGVHSEAAQVEYLRRAVAAADDLDTLDALLGA